MVPVVRKSSPQLVLGKGEEANNWFRQADELQIKIDGNHLYSLPGVFYAGFLLSMKRIDEAFELTKQNCVISQRENWPEHISRCHRCRGAIVEAREWLEKTVECRKEILDPEVKESETILKSL